MKTASICVGATFVFLAVTNPGKGDYVAWAQSKLEEGGDHSFGQALANVVAGPVISLATRRESYLLFSRYTTDLDPAHRIEAIGVMSLFVVMSSQGNPSDDRASVSAVSQMAPQVQLPKERSHRSNICFHEDGGHIVVERRVLLLAADRGIHPIHFDSFQTVVSARVSVSKSPDAERDVEFVGASEFDIYKLGKDCQAIFSETMDGVDSGRVEATELNGQGVIHLIGASSGGSGVGYRHIILLPNLNGLVSITPFDLNHSNMGGFFIGDLGGDRGPGIAIWDAIWNSGTHYSSHPYKISIYRWTGSSFLPPETTLTTEKFEPDPNELPTRLNLPFRDLTRQGEFARAIP